MSDFRDLTFSYCLVENISKADLDNSSSGSGNNLNPSDPLFVSAQDLRLQPDSPAIGAGNSLANTETFDLDGNPRLVPIAIDLGAYESQQISAPNLPNISLPLSSAGAVSVPLWAPDTSRFNNGSGFTFNFSAPSGSLIFDVLPTVDPDGTLRFTVPSGSSGSSSFQVTVIDPSQTFPDFPPVTVSLFLGDQIYVDHSATGSNNGSSWADAFLSLQDAIASASPGHEIWVADGAYYPDEGNNQTADDRSSTFQLRNELALYGGFSGTESSLSERDLSVNKTVLSGDLIQNDGPDLVNNSENAYNILTSSSTDSTAVLDSFTITGGNANLNIRPFDTGGGLRNVQGTPTLTNCAFLENFALAGGAISNRLSSAPSLNNCSFLRNSSQVDGGAILNESSSYSLNNCSFVGNFSHHFSGGAIQNFLSSPSLTNCSFQNNSAVIGGAISNDENSSPSHFNCSFVNNSASRNGGTGGAIANTIGSSPSFTNCSFLNNLSFVGGAIYNSFISSPSLINCSFRGNSAIHRGGAICNLNLCSPTLTNCILWDNSANGESNSTNASVFNGPPEPARESNPTYSHCLVANSGGSSSWNAGLGTDLGNNLDTDPLFASTNGGAPYLLPGSPALDVGDNAINTETLDLTGSDRIQNGTIDLGPLEGAITEVNFAILFPELDAIADDNNNGLSNYTDYALGGDPFSSNNPSLEPELTGNQLSFSFRNNATDVIPLFQKSDSLLSHDWEELIFGSDYTLGNETINGTQTVQTLNLSSSLFSNNRLFFREKFTETAP